MTTATSSPYRRDNYFGKTPADEAQQRGHSECAGTEAAEFIAFNELLTLTSPICRRALTDLDREIELSEPELYLPKQVDRGTHRIEYRQHRHRRRYNPETGWINWGETTSTAVPDSITKEVYMQAVHNYLWQQHLRDIDAWLTFAESKWHDQSLDADESLAALIRTVRAYRNPQNTDVTEVPE